MVLELVVRPNPSLKPPHGWIEYRNNATPRGFAAASIQDGEQEAEVRLSKIGRLLGGGKFHFRWSPVIQKQVSFIADEVKACIGKLEEYYTEDAKDPLEDDSVTAIYGK